MLSPSEKNSAHPERLEAQTRAAQVGAITRYSPLTMLVNAVNACLVAYVVWPYANPLVVAIWLFGVVAVVSVSTTTWIKDQIRGTVRRTASRRAVRRLVIYSGIFGAVWGFMPAAWMSIPIDDGRLVIIAVTTGMLCAGGFALSTVRPAANLYIFALTSGAIIALATSDISHRYILMMLLVIYAGVLSFSVWNNWKLFKDHVLAEALATERGQVIELLLAEFEENGSDWLFEIDAGGRIVRCSQRLLDVSGRAHDDVVGLRILGLLAPDAHQKMHAAMASGVAFRDLVVRAQKPGEIAWWSLTAKPLHDHAGALIGWRGVGSDITAAKVADDSMRALASSDPLTRLYNRSGFNDALQRQFGDRNARNALCLIDLDNFKSINDTFGHPVGDEVIRQVAEIFRDYESDRIVVGRLGGDEFAIMFGRASSAAAVTEIVEQILKDLTTTLAIDGRAVDLCASVGVAFSQDEETVDSLTRKADIALYRAKEDGRGRLVIYDEVMDRNAQEQRALLDGLIQALNANEFDLFYQPIVDLSQNRIVACEALIRWKHPRLGWLQPASFISLVETSTIVGDVARWVLRRACADAAKWPSHIRVAVNLSPANIGRSGLFSDIVEALAAAGLVPDRLELEITEALLIKHAETAVTFTQQMRSLGVRVALDDFGTGFSSLGYVARYPISKIKIDRSFVAGSAPLKSREAIISSVVKLAQDLDLETTAEGIETSEALEWITGLGCTQVQGYLFGRPMPLDDLLALFRAEGYTCETPNLPRIAKSAAA